MISVHDPKYNKEQIIKHLILLEDHLRNAPCPECMSKHLYAIEGFAEEGVSLGDQSMKELADKAREIRKALQEQIGAGHTHNPDAKREVAKLLLEMKPSSEKEEYARKEAMVSMLLARSEYDPSVQEYMREHGITREDLERWSEYWAKKRSDPSGEGESLEGVSEFYHRSGQTNPSLAGGSPPIVEHGENVWVEHFIPEEQQYEACDRRSFRVIKPNPEHILTICCPVGHWNPEINRCEVGTTRVKLEHLHPEESSCPVCSGG